MTTSTLPTDAPGRLDDQNRPVGAPTGHGRGFRSLGTTVRVILLIIVGLVFLIPLYWLISAALKPETEIYSWPLKFFPSTLEFSNFTEAWDSAPFGLYLRNSLIVTVCGAGLKVILAIFTAYAFAFLPFPGKRVIFLLMLGALMVPGHVTLLINFLTISKMGLVNTYAGIFLPGVASAFGTFLLRQHFLSLPQEVLEAAEMDGCGHLRRLLHFVAPMSRPAVITVALLAVIDEWNGFIWPLIATNSDEMRTVPIGLLYLKANEGIDHWGTIMAGAVIVVIPMLVIFLLAQKYIVSGLTGASMSR